MGEEVDAQEFSRADRTRYREKVRRCLDVFERMLREARFDTDDPMTGPRGGAQPRRRRGRPRAEERRGARGHRRPGLPDRARPVQHRDQRAAGVAARGRPRRRSRTASAASSTMPRRKSAEVGAHQVMIGILPTLARGPHRPAARSAPTRATSCSASRSSQARGEDIRIDISGPERLITTADSILPEAACTSTQFHVQTSPEQFAGYWNASQAISSVSSSRWAPTRRTAWARSCGARPGSRSSSRPPTPAARS